MIGSLLEGRKTEYFQKAYVQLAIWCLEQLRVRELHDVFPLEDLCHQLHQEPDQQKKQSIFPQLFQSVKELFMQDSGLEMSDKIRLLILLALSSNGISESDLDDLVEVGEIPSDQRQILYESMKNLGADLINHQLGVESEGKSSFFKNPLGPKTVEVHTEMNYQPGIVHLAENAISVFK